MWYTECSGDVELTVGVDGAVTGSGNGYVEEVRTDLVGDIVGTVDGVALTATWTIEFWGQPSEVEVSGRVHTGESLAAEFADVTDWYRFEGTMDATP